MILLCCQLIWIEREPMGRVPLPRLGRAPNAAGHQLSRQDCTESSLETQETKLHLDNAVPKPCDQKDQKIKE